MFRPALRMLPLAIVLAGLTATAAQIHVAPDGAGDVPDLQTAIAAAAAGDTIVLADGVFTGPGNRDLVLGPHDYYFQSLSGDATACVVDLEQSGGFDQTAEFRLTLVGLTITNGNRPAGGGAVSIEGGGLTARHCRFLNNRASEGGGAIRIRNLWSDFTDLIEDSEFAGNICATGAAIWANGNGLTLRRCEFHDHVIGAGTIVHKDSASGHFEHCVFRDNICSFNPVALSVTNTDVTDCLFTRNHGEYGGGIYFFDAGGTVSGCTFLANGGDLVGDVMCQANDEWLTPTFEHCLFAFSEGTYAIIGDPQSPPTFHCCDIFTNGGTWHYTIADQLRVDGNIDANPLVCDLAGGDLGLADISPCLAANNACGEQIGLYGEGCVSDGYVVYPDGHGALSTVQSAIDIVPAGGEVLLADGTFSGPGNRDLDFHGKALTLRSASGDPQACIIDAEGEGRGFHFHGVEGVDSRVVGLTVRGGSSNGAGGGALVESGSPVFEDCRFEGNWAVWGAGLATTDGAWPVLRSCVFHDNAGVFGAAISAQDAHVDAFSCTVAGNHSSGAALFSQSGYLRMEQSIVAFTSDSGPAILLLQDGDAYFRACDMFGNEGGDWTAPIADQLDLRDNFLAPPCFCDLETGVLSLCADSWCLPPHNPLHNDLLIGALPSGCDACECGGPVGVEVADFAAHAVPGCVTLSWRAPAREASDFRLTAHLGALTWPVAVTASDNGFAATDLDAHLVAGATMSYALALDDVTVEELAVDVPVVTSVTVTARPNPFNPTTTLRYQADRPGFAQLALYDLRGHHIVTLLSADISAGEGQATWNGRDATGRPVESGTYLCRLECASGIRTTSVTLVR